MEFRHAVFDKDGNITLEYNHPDFGWIPYLAAENDIEKLGRDLYAAAVETASAYTAPEELVAVPTNVTPRQARLALLQAGKLPFVEDAISNLPEPNRTAAQIEWEFASSIERNGPLTLILADALELSSAYVDNLFIEAAKL